MAVCRSFSLFSSGPSGPSQILGREDVNPLIGGYNMLDMFEVLVRAIDDSQGEALTLFINTTWLNREFYVVRWPNFCGESEATLLFCPCRRILF